MHFFEFSFPIESMSYGKSENYFTFSLHLLSPRHSCGYAKNPCAASFLCLAQESIPFPYRHIRSVERGEEWIALFLPLRT